MKKVILSVAALMVGVVAFAQVPGAPTAQPVTQLPGSATTANAGESIQNGNANKVQVRQAGTNQSVFTNQNDGSTGIGGNQAAVYQTGDVSDPSGIQNAAEVQQSGAANQSTTIQQGDFNNAYTAQGQNDDASSGNKARIQQGNNEQAESNYAAIQQDGIDNEAQTLQRWDNSDASTVQNGTANKSKIDQAAAPDGSDGHFADNGQNGANNESVITQSGAGARNSAEARQTGDGNRVMQMQTTDAASGGTGNLALAAQGEYTPTATTTQIGSLAADLDAIDGAVFGPDTESSFGATLNQIQSGNNNQVYAEQFGTGLNGGNYAEQVQSGTGNVGFVAQNFTDENDGNYAKQDQSGTNSGAALTQRGSANKSAQVQYVGDANQSLISQDGIGNLSNTHQFGDENVAHGIQRAESNRLNIVQRDGQSYLTQQNLNGLGGGMNQIDVLQLGPNGDFSTDGVDCGFDVPMDPMTIPDVPGLNLGDICPGC